MAHGGSPLRGETYFTRPRRSTAIITRVQHFSPILFIYATLAVILAATLLEPSTNFGLPASPLGGLLFLLVIVGSFAAGVLFAPGPRTKLALLARTAFGLLSASAFIALYLILRAILASA